MQSNAKTHGYQGKKKFGFEPHQVLENICTDLKLAQTLLNLTCAQIYFIAALKQFFLLKLKFLFLFSQKPKWKINLIYSSFYLFIK